MKNSIAGRAEAAVAAVLPRSVTVRCHRARIRRTPPTASEGPPGRSADSAPNGTTSAPRWTSACHSAGIPISGPFITSELRHILGHDHRPHHSPRKGLDTHRFLCQCQGTVCTVGRLVVTHEGFLQELHRAGLAGPGCGELLPMRRNAAWNTATRRPVPSHIAVTAWFLSEVRPPCAPYHPVHDRLVPSTRIPPGGRLPENLSGNKPVKPGVRPMNGVSPISLETTHARLGWPNSNDIVDPRGPAASFYARLVKDKIGTTIRRFPDARDARFGVLMSDPAASTSEPPLAIVAESHRELETKTLRELHRLAWNFSHVAVVITVEATLLRVWSCCEAPDPAREFQDYLVQSVRAQELYEAAPGGLEHGAATALHWINIVSGQFFADHSSRFDRDGRADQMLLKNLRHIRTQLSGEGLRNDDVCHDLLARIIFVQFLFDRKDQDGNSALNSGTLRRLRAKGILRNIHECLDSVLCDYEDTYRLFDWLNVKFNGDLFPGKGESVADRSRSWREERRIVEPRHLALLAHFVSGTLDMGTGQRSLWPLYAFDVIPLEFISCIYEAFVTERAARSAIYYTPSYLVDFILDRVLPWDDRNWDLKILDPACGSGIFLVKAFQRLVHRWKLSNEDVPIRAETLRRLLARNIFGVDIDVHAVRVACFSLYLAMCDEIEPRYYWTQVTFPEMRERRLICSDFFSERQAGISTEDDAHSYDVIIGNAPFGKGIITEEARRWAGSGGRSWTIPNNDIGGLFLAKSAHLVSQQGRVALIQSANTMLFNVGAAARFRKELFSKHQIDEIYNLSALRFRVFQNRWHTTSRTVAPVCVVVLRGRGADADGLVTYVSPKRLRPVVDEFTILIDRSDLRSVAVSEAIADSSIWSMLMWGGPRDIQLIRKLRGYTNLAQMEREGTIHARGGIVYGDRTKTAPHYDGRRILEASMFPGGGLLSFDPDGLPTVRGIRVHSRDSTNMDAFGWPQLIVKRSWHRASGRFHARLNASKEHRGVLCNQSYFSIHGPSAVLEAATMAHNSSLAVYFHFLTSGRFAAYRPKLSKDEVMSLPIPEPTQGLARNVEDVVALDQRVYELFELRDAERVLVEDAIEYTIADFVEGVNSKGRQRTGDDDGRDTHLEVYCKYFVRVMKAGFGEDRPVSAIIYRTDTAIIPYRILAFMLGGEAVQDVEVRDVETSSLLEELHRLTTTAAQSNYRVFSESVIRIYQAYMGVPTVFIVKPDQKRFWTRSAGLQDADEVALDLFRWQQSAVSEDALGVTDVLHR